MFGALARAMTPTSATTRRNTAEPSQSQDSLILHMSSTKPDSQSNDDDKAAAAAAEAHIQTDTNDNDKKPAATCHKVADLWQTVDRELRLNIGNSLKCGICLSTLTEPVRTPCVHAFCKDCIAASLLSGNKKCPECNTPITKRSLQPFEYLQDLCDAYKLTLKEFGMVPAKYTPNFTTMTQHVCSTSSTSDANEDELSPQDQLDRLDVATAWQQKALPLLSKENKIQELQVKENNQVVDANFKACGNILVPKAQLNSTQEVQELAREQQLADEAWRLEQEREEAEAKKQQRDNANANDATQDSYIFLTAPEEHKSSPNKRVSFSTKPPTSMVAAPTKMDLAINTSHASDDTEDPAEEDIITPKLTNVTFTAKAATDTSTVVVATPASSKRDSTLFASSISPIDVQASQETMPLAIATAALAEPEDSLLTKEAALSTSQTSETSAQQDDSKKETNVKAKKIAASRKETKNDKAKSNEEESVTTDNTRRSRRLSTEESANNNNMDEDLLSMPTPSPQQPQIEIMTLSHNDTEESEEIPTILEQGTQMTQDDGLVDTTAAAMMEDSFGALHLLPPKKKTKKRPLELSQSSQVSDDEEEDEEKAGEAGEAKKKSPQKDDPTDDDCTVPIKSQSPDSIRTKESSPTDSKPTKRVPRKRTSFGTATTTRFGAAAAASTQVEETTIPLNQEQEADEEEEDDRKPAARSTITPRPRRRRRKSGANAMNANEQGQNANNDYIVPMTPAAAVVTPASSRPRVWNVGEIVKVQPRTWPGVNKLGGVARVTKVWEAAGSNCSYDVAYILGGKESKVDAIFVVPSDDFDDESQPQQRRRRKADATELPMSMLQDLERQGFDTTGLHPLKTPHVNRKRPRLAPGSALKDSTNSKESNSKKTTLSKNKRKADTSTTELPKMTKTITKKAKENPKTKSEPKAEKSKTADAKTKTAINVIASLSLPEIFVKADDHYESIMDSAQRDGELYIVTSSLKEDEMTILKEVCSKSLGNIRLRLTDNFGKRTKICVLPVEESEDNIRPQIRTVKAVRSALAGIPMVAPDWIAQMKNEKKFIIPNTFVRSLPAKAVPGKKGGVAQYAAGIKSKQNLVLKGISLFLCGNFPDARRKDMHLVAKEAGATVLKTPQHVVDQLQQSKRVVVLCNTPNIAPAALEKQLRKSLTADSHAALVVGPGWLFDSIASVEELPPHPFPPPESKQRKAAELWKLCCASDS